MEADECNGKIIYGNKDKEI